MRRIHAIFSFAVFFLVAAGIWLVAAPTQQAPTAEAGAPKFIPPEILRTADAAYPLNSVAFGTVVLEVHLDASGEIRSVRVARDIASLTQPALEAIKHWRFKAATLDGKPVASVLPVAFIFVRPDLYPRYGSGQPSH